MAQKYTGWQAIINGNMVGSITGQGGDVSSSDNLGAEFVWTGTPTGVLKFQASNDSTDGFNGTWADVPASMATFPSQPAGGAGNNIVPLLNFPWKFIRVVYTLTSGTGTLNCFMFGKAL